MSTKFSQFASGGTIGVGAKIAGLDASVSPDNRIFDFPGLGILDTNGSVLLGWSQPLTGTAVNYLEFQNALTGNPAVISAIGGDTNVGLYLTTQNDGDISLVPGGNGFTIAAGTTAFGLPAGSTAQRPTAAGGYIRYNTDTGTLEYYNSLSNTWVNLAAGGSVINVTSADVTRITVIGTVANPAIDISALYVGQTSITTVGTLTAGSIGVGFATITVPSGGTGITSTTPYAVICGGTASTAALQQVAGLGVANQALLSSGAGALPVWGNVITSVTVGSGLSGGTITTTGTINVVINDLCSGRLTLTSDVPVTVNDVVAATQLYFTPFKGNYINLYNGATWDTYSFSEISIAIPAVSNQLYDVFVYNNAGTLTLSLTAWTNDTTRATNIVLQDGIYCKSGALTYRYLGSMRTNAAGRGESSVLNRYCWNYYNRVPRYMQVMPVTGWTYASATIRQADGAANPGVNQLNMVIGVEEDAVSANVLALILAGANNASASVGIGLDSTTTISSVALSGATTISNSGTVHMITSSYNGYVGIGKHSLVWLESCPAALSVTFEGSAYAAYSNTGISGYMLG